jgi:hypothetical protein
VTARCAGGCLYARPVGTSRDRCCVKCENPEPGLDDVSMLDRISWAICACDRQCRPVCPATRLRARSILALLACPTRPMVIAGGNMAGGSDPVTIWRAMCLEAAKDVPYA